MADTKLWLMKIKIVEHGREIIVRAATKKEARAKARRADWIGCSEATYHDVTVVGRVTEE